MTRPARSWIGRLAVIVATLVVVLWPATGAAAHALRIASDPDDGATLKTSPADVSITFSEVPDPALSSIKVLDTSGASHEQGKVMAVPGQPATLHVAVGHLADGVYTVTWRTVSKVDGHLAAGSFSFGVGVTPTATATAAAGVSATPSPATSAVVARWLFYAGTMLLFGVAVFRLIALARTPRRLKVLLAVGWLLAAGGAVAITQVARNGAGVPLGHLLSSSLGHAFLERAVPLVVLAAAVVVMLGTKPVRRWPVIVLAVGGAALMAGDVASTHAAAAHSWRAVQMGVQWLHFAAVSVWIGGLAGLVLVLPALASGERASAARRFSATAGVALVLVAASGAQRAIAEVGAWHALTSTTFGRWVVLKIGLLGGLVALGALNRYRHVRRADQGGTALRRVGLLEIGFASVALVATGFLQNLAPASVEAAAKPPPPLVVRGADFGTSVKVKLSITPAFAGVNRFVADVDDYDTGKPVSASQVSLRFAYPSRPDVAGSDLDLARQKDGSYSAQGGNLSLDGKWNVTVVVQKPANAVEVPLSLTTRTVPQTITKVVTPGLPTIYTLHLSAGRAIQIYLDPGKTGLNEFHETFLARDGTEIQMEQCLPTATLPGASQPISLTTRRLDPIGHFVSDVTGTAGNYKFGVDATANDGSTIIASITIPVR